MDASKNWAVRNPSPLLADRKMTEISNRPNWYLFYTGGLFTTGGLGWGLRRAYAEDPKAAILSYLTGSAGLCLFYMAAIPRSGKKASESSVPNWSMISGALISGAGFGYCLSFTLKENPKSTIIAYTVGSLGYIMTNAAVYTLCRKNEEKEKREKEEKKANAEILDSTYFSHARVHYTSEQCEICKIFVENVIRERKEAEKRQGLSSVCYCLWNSIKKFCPLASRAKDKDSLFVKKTSLLSNLEKETSKTCQDDNNPRKQSKSKYFRARIPINLSEDSMEMTASLSANSTPMTVPNKFPREKSTQMEYRIQGIQTAKENYLARSKETAMRYEMAMDEQFEDEVPWSAMYVFTKELQQSVEVPTENKQLQFEDKQ